MEYLERISRYIRSLVLRSTTEAGSGHPTSCLSAVDMATSLWFDGFFHFDITDPININNDKFILSKGHAAPLLYSLWVVAGLSTEKELMTLRKFASNFEGHPSVNHSLIDVATGSLGQGLSVGVGMSLASKKLNLSNKIYVLLGDGEMEEGSNYEALQIASYYRLDNLIGIIDVSSLEQTGETMLGGNSKNNGKTLQKRIESFGWESIVVNGHSFKELEFAFKRAGKSTCPFMIIAITKKGKGISFLEGKQGWHGKVLDDSQLKKALNEIREYDPISGQVLAPIPVSSDRHSTQEVNVNKISKYKVGDVVSTRQAYGTGLVKAGINNNNIICLDAGVANSTFAQTFKKNLSRNYYEMFIAEQNMISVAVGMSKCGLIPFASTFAAFLTRAHDQIRMASYSKANIKIVGSHAGVSIGDDGPSQMGLEDIAMMRSIVNSVVLYPSDAVSTEKLVNAALSHGGIVYIRTTRANTPVIYEEDEEFVIGGCKVVKKSEHDQVVIFSVGITLHESLKAYEELMKENISICIVDVYSVKPLDEKTIKNMSIEYHNVIVVEDHYREGGIGEAIAKILIGLPVNFVNLAVNKTPRSGKPQELLDYEEISSGAIINSVKKMLQ